jgi:hypothetical protein
VSSVAPRQPGQPLKLWDVDNTEAHVRKALAAGLTDLRARLDPAQELRLFTHLWLLCWRLSGLEADAKTERDAWEVRGFLSPRGPMEPYELIKLPQFRTEASAGVALVAITWERKVAFAKVEKVRPTGAYDKTRGISFSTYSFRILKLRVIDWYRSDPEFGDRRYSKGQRAEESLEALAERLSEDTARADDSGLARYEPAGRLGFIDDLNRNAYQDSIEEVVCRAAIGC